MTRRDIIGSVGSAALTASSYSRVPGANDRLSIGLIGCGGRGGRELSPVFLKVNGPFTAVCDLWKPRAESAAANSPGAKIFADHRRLLELPGLDAVVVATSDHWHAAITIEAMNAGKDVYVEKPLTPTMEEGARIIQAARVNQRICQAGTQQRSGTKGHLRIDRDRVEFFPSERGAPPVPVDCKTDIVEEHVRSFVDCCRSRKTPNCDVAAGHRSAQAAHLGNLSYAEKRRIHFDPDQEILL